MTVFEKNENLKKNKYIHLATLTASLALAHVSDVSSSNVYVSPTAAFVSLEGCDTSVGCGIEALSFLETHSSRGG